MSHETETARYIENYFRDEASANCRVGYLRAIALRLARQLDAAALEQPQIPATCRHGRHYSRPCALCRDELSRQPAPIPYGDTGDTYLDAEPLTPDEQEARS